MNHKIADSVVLISEDDQVIGTMEKLAAHRQGLLHRAISVFLFRKNEQGEVELLVQKRSLEKIVGAGEWANTACGNVRPGERYVECAIRRLRVELGLEVSETDLTPLLKFTYFAQCNAEFAEHEMDQVFVGWYNGNQLTENPAEVIETEWITWGKEDSRKWAVWFEIMMNNSELQKLLNEFVK